jgi:hypothetical protein
MASGPTADGLAFAYRCPAAPDPVGRGWAASVADQARRGQNRQAASRSRKDQGALPSAPRDGDLNRRSQESPAGGDRVHRRWSDRCQPARSAAHQQTRGSRCSDGGTAHRGSTHTPPRPRVGEITVAPSGSAFGLGFGPNRLRGLHGRFIGGRPRRATDPPKLIRQAGTARGALQPAERALLPPRRSGASR